MLRGGAHLFLVAVILRVGGVCGGVSFRYGDKVTRFYSSAPVYQSLNFSKAYLSSTIGVQCLFFLNLYHAQHIVFFFQQKIKLYLYA